MKSRELNEEQILKIADILSSAIVNKQHSHVSDLRLASVLIFSLIRKGYYFNEEELETTIRLSGGDFSDTVKKNLKEITWVCNELADGLDNTENEKYRLNDFE